MCSLRGDRGGRKTNKDAERILFCIRKYFNDSLFSLQNQFRFETESSGMNDNYKKVLYDGRLSNSIVFMYNPVRERSLSTLKNTY